MQTDQNKITASFDKEFEPAFSALEKVTKLFASVAESDDARKIQSVLNKALKLCHQAGEIFLEKDQPWLAAWTCLRKASLHCELAHVGKDKGRDVQTRTAMELLKNVLDSMEADPPSVNMAAKLYDGIIYTLFRIRSLFNESEQIEALDDMIKVMAENLGETMALDLSLRAEANDLKFTAGILGSLADFEEDPILKQDMQKTSRDLLDQAKGNVILSGTLDASAYSITREGK
jgi:hypothetical protein